MIDRHPEAGAWGKGAALSAVTQRWIVENVDAAKVDLASTGK
jgi:hypothetical protein